MNIRDIKNIDDVNTRFALISVGTTVVVMEIRPDKSIKELWSVDEFKKLLMKKFVMLQTGDEGKPTKVALGSLWLKSERGRQYERLVYAMPGSTEIAEDNDYNGWLGYSVAPAPGDWGKNCDHILNVICAGHKARFAWVMNWCAALVQSPGRHGMVAPVLRGGQGTGKGHFADYMLGRTFQSQQYIHIIGSNQLTGQFNSHLSGKVLVFADESTWGGDPKAADRLKGMVTEDNIPIERKFVDQVKEPSALHVIIASNNEWPVAIDARDRRFMVLDVPDGKQQNDVYFGELREEMTTGGRAAMLFDLMAWPVDWAMTRRPLITEGKIEIAELSLKPIERWWLECLKRSEVSIAGDDFENKRSSDSWVKWPDRIEKADIHRGYLRFLEHHGYGNRDRRATETELGVFLRKFGAQEARQVDADGSRTRYWLFKTVEACRSEWVRRMGWDAYLWGEGGAA